MNILWETLLHNYNKNCDSSIKSKEILHEAVARRKSKMPSSVVFDKFSKQNQMKDL